MLNRQELYKKKYHFLLGWYKCMQSGNKMGKRFCKKISLIDRLLKTCILLQSFPMYFVFLFYYYYRSYNYRNTVCSVQTSSKTLAPTRISFLTTIFLQLLLLQWLLIIAESICCLLYQYPIARTK